MVLKPPFGYPSKSGNEHGRCAIRKTEWPLLEKAEIECGQYE
jgi:hypothetical protein